jgi:acyl-CoA dehydrogenase
LEGTKKFQWGVNMSFLLTHEQEMIVNNIKKLTKKYDRKYWLENYQQGTFPVELWREISNLGYLGLTVPEEYGGLGMGIQELALVEEELSRAGLPIVLLVISPALGTVIVSKHGSIEQKKKYLPGTVTGEKTFCFAITEPNAGTNTFKINTFAKKDGNEYIISGQKQFITAFDIADYMLLVARTSPYDKNDRYKGLSLFVMDTNCKGIEKSLIDVQVAKVEKQWMLYFNDVRVPADALVGEEGKGIKYLFDALNPERIMVASMCIGLGEYVLDKTVEYANQREVFSGPIGKYQALQHPMAEAKAHLELAKLMNRRAAWNIDNNKKAANEANIAKFAAADAGVEACDIALQVHGGNAYTKEYDLMNIYSFLRLQKTAPVSREMILNYIGEHMLGLPKSY